MPLKNLLKRLLKRQPQKEHRMMKYNLEKYINYYVYLGFSLIFSILVLIATRGEAPYASTAFTLGSFQVQWYAVFILTGIVFAVMLSYLEIKRVKMDPEILWDGLLIFIPFSIVSARLWYVLFNLDRYQNDWGRIFNLTEGGLGIHGAVIGTFIALIWFTRRKKISYWFLLDIVAPGFLIGQTLGRWGNFMNRELYGPIADNLNWLPSFIKDQMFIQGAYRHPTFLYESLWNLTGLILILVLRKKRLFKLGDILACYLVWYGIGRIPTETLRLMSGVDEPLMAFGIPVSITTSILFILAGLTIMILKR